MTLKVIPARVLALAALTLTLMLSGCGFELRGAQVLPAGKGNLFVNAPSNVRREIGNFLDGTDTRIVTSAGAADVVLNVASATYDRRVLSVDPNTGKEREFELSLSLNFNARDASGKSLVAAQNVTLLRDYVFDSDAIIGKSREEGVLRREMLRDAVQQMLARVRSATGAG